MEHTKSEGNGSRFIKTIIRCPVCGETKSWDYPEPSTSIPSKLSTIFFPKGVICPHGFNAYVDAQGKVRGYQPIDFVVPSFNKEAPQFHIQYKKEDKLDEIKFDLIYMNFTHEFLTYIFRVIFFRKKVIILESDNSLISHLKNFLNYVTEGSFVYESFFFSKDHYEVLKKNFKDYVVLEKGRIIHCTPDFLSKKKKNLKKQLKIENYLINKFISLKNYKLSLNIFREEVHTIYILADTISKYAQKILDKDKINITEIREVLKVNISSDEYNPYIDYLIQISRKYFGARIPRTYSTAIDFL